MSRSMDRLASKCLSVIVAVLLLGPSAGCEFSCGSGGVKKRVEKSIAKQLAKQLDVKVKKVTCPKDIEGKEDDVTMCTATLPDGKVLDIEVLWTDDMGGFTWRAKDRVEDLLEELSTIITEGLASKYEAEISGTTCPDKVELKKDGVFECVATIAGGSKLPVRVTWTNDKGAYRYIDKGVVSLDKLELLIGEQLAHEKTPGKVDCHGKIRASDPESSFMCDIAYADGKSGQVKIIVKDWSGRVDFEFQPPSNGAAPKP